MKKDKRRTFHDIFAIVFILFLVTLGIIILDAPQEKSILVEEDKKICSNRCGHMLLIDTENINEFTDVERFASCFDICMWARG